MSDVLGQAMLDYLANQHEENITVQSPDFDDDVIPVEYLFRSFREMPILEQKALELAKGETLDVGCGAGSHAHYLATEKNLNVTAIDTSPGAVEVCRLRGIKQARVIDFYDLESAPCDTILMLMNGTGIMKNLAYAEAFFTQLKRLLSPAGQVLIDSSDLRYLFDENEDGGIWIDASQGYYGELTYRMKYKHLQTDWFDWLYLDYASLEDLANTFGFNCELVQEGAHFDYLARLTLSPHTPQSGD
ncbi:methyltransferase domain-containing protein [Gangjinia marincola]|uniref:Methyltransferase domain-containing protein n=1 Tax=Gangjinia marincola TaxID=578463 RepID=A0ABP3XPH6_9FLAO